MASKINKWYFAEKFMAQYNLDVPEISYNYWYHSSRRQRCPDHAKIDTKYCIPRPIGTTIGITGQPIASISKISFWSHPKSLQNVMNMLLLGAKLKMEKRFYPRQRSGFIKQGSFVKKMTANFGHHQVGCIDVGDILCRWKVEGIGNQYVPCHQHHCSH